MEANGNHAAATVYLDKLAEELSNRGLEAWQMAPPGRVPSVYVTNPGARALEENVYAYCGKDGLWWFWWPWAERISMADDVDAAATVIARVLSLPRSALSAGALLPADCFPLKASAFPAQPAVGAPGSAGQSGERDRCAAPGDGAVRRGLHRLSAERAQRLVVHRDQAQVRARHAFLKGGGEPLR